MKKKNLKNEEKLRNFWDNFKCSTIQIIGMPEGEEEEEEIENLLEKIMENFSKEIDIQVQEAQKIPMKFDTRRSIPRHIIIKLPKIKDKERILKAPRERRQLASNVS